MREIKFRAYDEDYEKMTYFDDEDYNYIPPCVFRLEQVFKKDSNYDDYEDFEYTDITSKVEVMQYTGLHDKNGKEIYEGDIIQYGDIHKGVVEYSDKYAQFILKETDNITDECEALGEFNIKVFEIIGNIYEGVTK